MEDRKTEGRNERIGQEQFHHLVFKEEVSWQEIIYDLINSEQLDPWDINLSFLSEKYIGKIRELEEANFILSSKVLLVASLMLKLKSELLMNRYIKDLDDVLFERKKEEIQQKIEFDDYDEGEFPELLPRTPLPRNKKISLKELIAALDKAVNTETRREIKKRIEKEQEENVWFFMPKKKISLSDSIKNIHGKIRSLFEKTERVRFSEFAGEKKEDKIDSFIPLLHLDNHNKLWLQQERHFDEIWIHKDGKKFMERDEILTGKIEEKFEESLEEE
ncbi:hypothetical protein CMI46_02095 [Candidatus Pacearchaeota archaeon]|nr:hypothetical protein [Candidatus Pacearchaeota archaeon]|tara:strand:+ start:9114 stop:9938 length:825 start_codon:yes stop_codon:yes gene_type:complete